VECSKEHSFNAFLLTVHALVRLTVDDIPHSL